MQSPTMEQFDRLGEEVQQLRAMMEKMMALLGTLGAEMREGFRSQQAEMQSLRDEMKAMRSELTEKMEGLRHDLRSERRARGHWQAETEHRISSLELQLEGKNS